MTCRSMLGGGGGRAWEEGRLRMVFSFADSGYDRTTRVLDLRATGQDPGL